MTLGDTLAPVGDVISFNAKSAGIFFMVLIVLAVIGGAIYFIQLNKKKKKQWTHELIVQKELPNGQLSKSFIHKMKRFPAVRGAEVFDLEKPFLGGWLFPALSQYSDVNKFEIILDKANSVYIKIGEQFDKVSGMLKISGKHAEVDLAIRDITDNWQKEHKEAKKISTADLIKAGLKVILIVGGVIAIKFMAGAYLEAKQTEAGALDQWVSVSENFIIVASMQQDNSMMIKEDNDLMRKEFCKDNSGYSFCRVV
jgi:hypothetical protein